MDATTPLRFLPCYDLQRITGPSQRGHYMATVTSIVRQLKKERDKVERQLSGLNAALSAFAKVYTGTTKPTRKNRKLSARVRAKMAAAQRARWAKVKAKKKAA